ncbi:sarcosine oxidase subunit gamma [Algicella marina]|nr:sarcosine oxidase subunit gamma [Algicella marina]
MAESGLRSVAPLAGSALPIEAGDVRLTAVDLGSLCSVQPFRGCEEEANKVCQSAFGQALEVSRAGGAIWMGRGQWFLTGVSLPDAQEKLGDLCALTDQTSGWAVFDIVDPTEALVMARLCPLDVERMKPGDTARTEFAHMMSSVTALEDGYRIMVMRSFAASAIHHTKTAMASVVACRTLAENQ